MVTCYFLWSSTWTYRKSLATANVKGGITKCCAYSARGQWTCYDAHIITDLFYNNADYCDCSRQSYYSGQWLTKSSSAKQLPLSTFHAAKHILVYSRGQPLYLSWFHHNGVSHNSQVSTCVVSMFSSPLRESNIFIMCHRCVECVCFSMFIIALRILSAEF